MFRTRNLTFLVALMAASGCRHTYVVPETPLPPNTVLLAQMMRELSARPGFTEALLKQIDAGGSKGPAIMTPALINELRKRILGDDWQGLDRFPGWTMREINPTVGVIGDVVAKHAPTSSAQVSQYIDLGPYAMDKAQTVSLDTPSTLPPFTTVGQVEPMGAGVVRGDGPNDLAPEHAESQRLADVLNRLAANGLDRSARFIAGFTLTTEPLSRDGLFDPAMGGSVRGFSGVISPENLIYELQETGHTVTVDDARYFANFGHLHYSARGPGGPAQDVMMPFWIDSQIVIPHSHGRHLLVPAAHAEYEWHIRGPLVNADVSYYFGIDGKSEWRTMDTLDQPWVMERNAHEYTGAQAVEVTRLAGLLTVAYLHTHAAHPGLPFGGYYALGVCQDGVAAIEQKMTGASTLFPNTADMTYFNDPRDAEANALLAAIPKDRNGAPPTPARIFGSLPVTPQNFRAVSIPGLGADLQATYAARQQGRWSSGRRWTQLVAAVLALFACVTFLLCARKRATPAG
jgi:hypothetical protein